MNSRSFSRMRLLKNSLCFFSILLHVGRSVDNSLVNKLLHARLEQRSRELRGMAPKRRGLEQMTDCAITLDSLDQAGRRRLRKENPRRTCPARRVGIVDTDHAFQRSAFTVSNYGPAACLRFQRHDAKVLFPGKDHGLTPGVQVS